MKFRSFQKSDFARAALPDSAIVGLDPGLGKTFCAFTWPMLKCGATATAHDGTELPVEPDLQLPAGFRLRSLRPNKPVLLLAPGDQHENVIAEGRRHFRIDTVRLPTQDAYLALQTRTATGTPEVPPGFYLCSYHELAQNGTFPFPEIGEQDPVQFMAEWAIPQRDVIEWYQSRGSVFATQYDTTGAKPEMTLKQVEQAARRTIEAIQRGSATAQYKAALASAVHSALVPLSMLHGEFRDSAFAHLSTKQQDWCRRRYLEGFLDDCQKCNGETRELGAGEQGSGGAGEETESIPPAHLPTCPPAHRVTCLHSPALVDLCSSAFDCVVLDEGVKMKGDDTIIGLGVRRMNPRYRLVMSGTPIKNRLPDLFWLISWINGMSETGTPRWPFPADLDSKADFAGEFLVSERSQTAKAKKGSGRFKRVTAEVCNLHRLFKLLGPNILRRRKDDIGEDIVAKHAHQVSVPMGARQKDVYAHHMAAHYWCGAIGNPLPNPMHKLMALRQAAAAPWTAKLLLQADSKEGRPRSDSIWTPKLAAALGLIRDALRRGRQCAVFSSYHEASATLERLLLEAGVRCIRLDGDASPTKRGRLSQHFQAGLTAGRERAVGVALCGVEATAEGHNWWRAGTVIRYDLALALDKNRQCIERVHRLTSETDVEVWDILVDGTTDFKLMQMSHEKGDAADLVLDGRLMGHKPEEVNASQLLDLAQSVFQAESQTIDENTIAGMWPQLRTELRQAFEEWLTKSEATAPALAPAPAYQLSTPSPSTTPMMTLQQRLTAAPIVVAPPRVPGHAIPVRPAGHRPTTTTPTPAPKPSALPWLAKLQALGRRN